MDVRDWKRVLLQWVSECGFMERNYFNMEQTDINMFYSNFRRYHKVIAKTSHCSHLIGFLQEHYPELQPHLDDEGELSSADYIYVYSLLLHFCCVKYPDPYFHEICQRLSEHSQQSIAAFFKLLIEYAVLSRENIRHAIANVPVKQPSPVNDSYTTSCQPSSSTSVSDSPMKIPKGYVVQRISPSTPKTFMLEERTRDLYNLRAQLETERYEKGLLEVQIKQNEEKISKLNEDHRRLRQQIQDLKNDILTKNMESNCPSNEGDEQMRRRLCKEIAYKDQEITKMNESLAKLGEENNLMHDKHVHAEKQIITCIERIKELEYKLDEMTADVERKDYTIKYLTENKHELEQFINEVRSGSGSSRHELNVSADCLDVSMSRMTNSSGATGSPENLGCSVVDIQLREKENENYQLKEELAELKESNSRLVQVMKEVTTKQVGEFSICIDSLKEYAENDFLDPVEYLELLVTCLEKLGRNLNEEKAKVRDLQEEIQSKQKRGDDLNIQVFDLEKETCALKETMRNIKHMNVELEQDKKRLQEKMSQCEREILKINEQKFELVEKLEKLTTEYDNTKEGWMIRQRELELQLQCVEVDLRESDKRKAENMDLKSEVNSLQNKVQALQQSLLNSNEELKMLSKNMHAKEMELSQYENAQEILKEKYEKLLVHYEALKKDKRETTDHMETIRNNLAVKEMEMGKLGTEIEEVCKKNAELERRIDKIMTEFRNEKHNSDIALNKRDEQIREITKERNQLAMELEKGKDALNGLQSQFENCKEEMRGMSDKIGILHHLLGGEKSDNEIDFAQELVEIIKKVKDLIEFRNENTNRIELLHFDNMENVAKLQEVEEQLEEVKHEKKELISKHGKQLNEMKRELQQAHEKIKEFEEKVERLKEEHNRHCEALMNSEKETRQRAEQSAEENDRILISFKEELRSVKKECLNKENELKHVVDQHNLIQMRLHESEQQLADVQRECNELHGIYVEKFNGYEKKVKACTAENMQLIEKINAFKQEHNIAVHRLKEADAVLNDLSQKLSNESVVKSDLNAKLKSSRARLTEAEQKLSSAMEEKAQAVRDLQKNLETQQVQVERLQSQVADLEDLKGSNATSLTKLDVKLQKAAEQNNELAAQLEREQSERSELLLSLEHTADQLRLALNEKSALNGNYKKLNGELERANKLIFDLQNELKYKEEVLEQHGTERDDWQAKFSELIREQVKVNNALEDIVLALENNVNLSSMALGNHDVRNVFIVEEDDVDTSVGRLKVTLNKLINDMAQLNCQINQVEQKRLGAVEVLTKTNEKLTTEIMEHKREIVELRKSLDGESKSVERQLCNEVKRLKDDMHNLEIVNEKLADENVVMQIKISDLEKEVQKTRESLAQLEEENRQMSVEMQENAKDAEQQKEKEKELGEEIRAKQLQVERAQERCKKLENQMQEKTKLLTAAEENLRDANEKITETAHELQETLQQLTTNQRENSDLQERHKRLQELHTAEQSELANLKAELAEVLQHNKNLEEQNRASSQRYEELMQSKLGGETKYDQLYVQFQQQRRDYEFCKSQHQTVLTEVERLQEEKRRINLELKEGRHQLQREMDNVSHLIQQIQSIRIEKDTVVEQYQKLRKRAENSEKFQAAAQAKIGNALDRTKGLEQKLLTAENDLKSIRALLQKATEKLNSDNFELREYKENAEKRLEKISIQLGESRGRCATLERENNKLTKTIETSNATVEALQRDKNVLQCEVKALKERLSTAERSYEQHKGKLQRLEDANVALTKAKQKLEASENDAKSKLSKLEKMRETNEDKIRKLEQELNNCENKNVKQSLEIGALNSMIKELQSKDRGEAQIDELNRDLVAAKEEAQHFEELNKQLGAELQELREKNSEVTDQLTKVTLSLQISKERCEKLASEMENLRSDMSAIRDQKDQLEEEHLTACAKLHKYKDLYEQLITEHQGDVKSLETKIAGLQSDLSVKSSEMKMLNTELETLRDASQKKAATAELTASEEMENLRIRLTHAEEVLDTEQKLTAQLRLDNQILQAKYRDSKQRLAEEAQVSEERIKENRLELEGKLEKMKNKMKTLYTEEITKMKAKQEREMINLKSEMDVLKAQNTKFEEQVRKLSTQVVRLNENILEHQKENTFLKTKLKHLQEREAASFQFKRPSSINVPSGSSITAAVSSGATSNLAMEDEEGEVFNNTYLADLKSGRMSINKNISPGELQFRNSLQPPHLKCTYAAQYDSGLHEDEMKVSKSMGNIRIKTNKNNNNNNNNISKSNYNAQVTHSSTPKMERDKLQM